MADTPVSNNFLVSTGSTYVLSRSERMVENRVTGSVNLFSEDRAGMKRDETLMITPAVKDRSGTFSFSRKATILMNASDWKKGAEVTLVMTLSN